MKRLPNAVRAVLSSRALPPVVIGIFFLLYVGIAFGTDETLTALMEITRKSVFLAGLLALLPMNSAFRILEESVWDITRRRVLTGRTADVQSGLFDETIEMPVSPHLAELQERLDAVGYKTCRREDMLIAWRGISIFPARLLFLAGTFCLFTGILISLTSRISHRVPVIEGEPLSAVAGGDGRVVRIALEKSSGLFLDKTLTMEVASPNPGKGTRLFGLYPPSRHDGYFVYPRYLGAALFIRSPAPDLPAGYETHCIPNIYPPGKEDNVEIPGSPYRIVFMMSQPDDGTDPYVTGRMIFLFKLLKEKEVLFTGSALVGGEFGKDGCRLAILDGRRMVITDFIRDNGVPLVWVSAMLFFCAAWIWVPVRICFPRREMLFIFCPEVIRAHSRAEGRGRMHGGVFHEALDLLDGRRPDRIHLTGDTL